MSLRNRISCTAQLVRLIGYVVCLVGALLVAKPWLVFPLALIWVFTSGRLLRRTILPRMFPNAVCPGCGRSIPLFARWKCGDHFTSARPRHILAFVCSHGHRLEGFGCPRCQSTILVQRGEPLRIRYGSARRHRAQSNLSKATGLLLGYDPHRRQVTLSNKHLAWHAAISGGTGRGKSTLLANLCRQLVASGRGFTLLDPGGDLARLVLTQIPNDRAEDVLFVDVADTQHPFPLNILQAESEMERAMLVEELLDVFQRLYSDAWGHMLAHQLRFGLQTTIAAGGTLHDVYAIFTDPNTRSRLLSRVKDPILRNFWQQEFPAIPATRRSAVTNKLAPLIAHPILGPLTKPKECIIDGDRIIRDRQILIVSLATGSPSAEVTTLLGSFLMHRITAAAFRQSSRPDSDRRPHVLIADEAQRFVHRASSIDRILSEARKFKLSLIMANQFIEQLPDDVRAAVFGNVGCLIAFRAGHRDARVLEPEFSGCHRDELMELRLGECLIRLDTDWTTIRTPPPPAPVEQNAADRIIQRSRQHVSLPVETTEESESASQESQASDDDLVQ